MSGGGIYCIFHTRTTLDIHTPPTSPIHTPVHAGHAETTRRSTPVTTKPHAGRVEIDVWRVEKRTLLLFSEKRGEEKVALGDDHGRIHHKAK